MEGTYMATPALVVWAYQAVNANQTATIFAVLVLLVIGGIVALIQSRG